MPKTTKTMPPKSKRVGKKVPTVADLLLQPVPVSDPLAELLASVQAAVDEALRRRTYDPGRPMLFQCFDQMFDVAVVRQCINDEFAIMIGYLRSRLRKEFDTLGLDMNARLNSQAEHWSEIREKVISGQHKHLPDIQSLVSDSLVRIWKKCKSKRFIERCRDRDNPISPIVAAVCRAARDTIQTKYGTKQHRVGPQTEFERELGEMGDEIADGLSTGDGVSDILDIVVAREERGITAHDAGSLSASVVFAPRTDWRGRSLESQVAALWDTIAD